MKITKLKKGYSIKCTDGDFMALQVMVSGQGAGALTDMAKSAYTRRMNKGPYLRVDRNKRDA